MRLWRIAHHKYALDRQGSGVALHGGRWNPVGLPALYCGGTIAITAMEKLVHLGAAPWPPLVLVAVDFPDKSDIYEPGLAALPSGWDALPISPSAQAFGGAWLQSNDSLAMKVPSVLVPEEANFVINPKHADYHTVQLSISRPFSFDQRLIK